MRKKRFMYLLAVPLLLIELLLAFYSCDQSISDQDDESTKNDEPYVNSTPYATDSELDEIAIKSDEYVDWRISRVFAVIEKESFVSENDWDNSKVSERPVLIYDYQYKPKYYEFRVIKNGVEVGAITCNAQKAEGNPVKYIINTAPEYAVSEDNRGTEADMKIIDTGYPAKVITKRYNRNDKQPELDSFETEISVKQFLKHADAEELEKLGITTDSMKTELLEKANAKEAEIEIFWKKIDEYKESIVATTDKQIEEAARSNSTRGNYNKTFYANPWYNNRNWGYSLDAHGVGACGPYCLSFIAVAADCFPGVSWYPTQNYKTVYAVTCEFRREVGGLYSGPHIWEQLAPALSKLTPYKLDLGWFGDKSHDWKKIDQKMRQYNAPAISLRTSAIVNGSLSLAFHYRVILGTHHEHKEWQESFLWWKWTASSDKYYYYMHDNGSDGDSMGSSCWWVAAGSLAQFESVTVRRK